MRKRGALPKKGKRHGPGGIGSFWDPDHRFFKRLIIRIKAQMTRTKIKINALTTIRMQNSSKSSMVFNAYCPLKVKRLLESWVHPEIFTIDPSILLFQDLDHVEILHSKLNLTLAEVVLSKEVINLFLLLDMKLKKNGTCYSLNLIIPILRTITWQICHQTRTRSS